MAGTEESTSKEAKRLSQVFGEGDFVVYPNHGAGCVAGVEEKTILGEARRYYIVYISDAELTLSIPADGESGLRACSGEERIEAALAALRSGATEMPSNWNHRLKHNREKIGSGEIVQVAEVVRNLNAYGGEHGLSTGERNMFLKARRILASEIALVRGIKAAEAEVLLDDVLSEGVKEHSR